MSKIVCVTGCTGYVASELVLQCLELGWTVHGTARNITDESKVGSLKTIAQSLPGKLELFQADLLQPGSFDDAVAGCEYVFHTASPFALPDEKDSPAVQEQTFIKPAVEGTKNVLQSVAKHKATIKCVSLTSSVVAMLGFNGSDQAKGADGLFSEADWNETSTYTTLGGAYPMSKTLAEKAAWEIAERESFKLVAINPGLVLGPPRTSRTDGFSIEYGLNILNKGIIGPLFPVADCRDVAKAHIASCINEKSTGRYYVGSTFAPSQWMVYDAIATLALPNVEKPEKPEGADLMHILTNEKVQSTMGAGLGIQLTDVKTTVYDMIKSMQENS